MHDTQPAAAELLGVPDRPLTLSAVDFGLVRRATELALRLGDAAVAWRAAHAMLRAFPDAAAPLSLLGQALLEAGNAGVAADHFRRALRINPLDSAAWAGLAGALARTARHGAAAAAITRAALHDPLGSDGSSDSATPSGQGAGILYLRRGMHALAVAELADAVAHQPRRADLRVHFAEALRRNGDGPGARRELDALLARDQGGLPALMLRAALATPAEAPALRTLVARHDPDGFLTRRFFAPERTPWELPPSPALPWSEDIEPIEPYLPLVLGRQQQPAAPAPRPHVPERAPEPAPALAASPEETVARKRTPAGGEPDVVARKRTPAEADQDVRSFIATAERLRHRIADVSGAPRPLMPWASGALTQVILSSRTGLLRRFGDGGFQAVDERLHLLAEALRRRGLHAHVCYCDDPESLRAAAGADVPPAAQDPAALRDMVRAMAEALAGHGRELGVLLIIGGDDIVPFHRLPNPIPDDDPQVLSDNPYASDDAGHLIPQRVVARVPEGAAPDPSLLLAILDGMVQHHSGRQQRGRLMLPLRAPRPAPRSRTVSGYCAEVWQETSRAALDALEPEGQLLVCPPLDAGRLEPRALAGGRLLYVNLHGAQGLPNFYGQPDLPWPGPASRLPVALRPDQVATGLQGGMLLAEACYGAELAGRTPASSIPLQALASGALAFVGATVNAYGSSQEPLVAADLLFQRMLTHVGRGAPLGESLHHARLEFAQEMYRRQGYLDDVDVKTLIEFVLLGDPWAALDGPSPDTRATWPATKIAGIERVPKPRPKAVVAEHDLPGDLVRRAREALQRLLPGVGATPLLITAQPNPRHQRKGAIDQDLVFSATDTRATADGYYVTQAAHVTMSGRAVVKMVQTR